MKKIVKDAMLLASVVGVGLGAIACKSTAAQGEAEGAEVAQRAANLIGRPGTNVQVTEKIVNGKPFRRYVIRSVDSNGALTEETFEQQDKVWSHTKRIGDTKRSKVYQPSINQIYNDTPVFDHRLEVQNGVEVSEGVLLLPQEEMQQPKIVVPASNGKGKNIVIIKNAEEKQPQKN